jgi:hypothetical protein
MSDLRSNQSQLQVDFRKPRAFGGIERNLLWQIGRNKITRDWEAVRDSPTHVSIMSKGTMLLVK